MRFRRSRNTSWYRQRWARFTLADHFPEAGTRFHSSAVLFATNALSESSWSRRRATASWFNMPDVDVRGSVYATKRTDPAGAGSVVRSWLLTGARFGEVTMNFGNELSSRPRRTDLSVQDLREGNFASIDVLRRFIILFHLSTVDVDAGEEAFCPRIGQDFRVQFNVGVRSNRSPNRTGSSAGVHTDFELAGKQLLHALVVHDEHENVRRGTTDLRSPASSTKEHGCRCAPLRSVIGKTASREAAAIASTESQCSFLLVRDDDHAFRMAQQV